MASSQRCRGDGMLNLLALTWVYNHHVAIGTGANNPFCGHRPNSLAGIALVTQQNAPVRYVPSSRHWRTAVHAVLHTG